MHNNSHITAHHSPWSWVPSLYFTEGLPYVAIMTVSVIMYKRLGLSNTETAFYTSWLYLPWIIKPLWSPFVDIIRTKRFWIITMQSLIAVGFAGIALFIPSSKAIQITLMFFWLLAFGSATHDIAADGFYMLSLSIREQSFFVGIRNTFYRLATIVGQGLLIMLAGWLEKAQHNIPLAWSMSFAVLAGLFIGITLYHHFILPHPETCKTLELKSPHKLLKNFAQAFVTFFKKPQIGLVLFFLLTYRLGEAQLVKLTSPFLLDSVTKGGLGLSTVSVGMIYGTIGVICLLIGGIGSGILVSHGGLRKWLLPMALAMNLPDLLYVWLSLAQPNHTWMVVACVAIEQLGYGFGFTAYTLYLIRIAQNPYKTAHYAIGTGFMALGMMIPGIPSGWIQERIGYPLFFIWVCLCTLPGIAAALIIKKKELS